MSPAIDRHLTDGIATITLNRPDKLNAFDNDLSAALREAVTWATQANEVRVITLRGAGRSFSSGRDTSVLGAHPGGVDLPYLLDARETNRLLRSSPKPILAALHGHVLGMAFEIALAADFRIAADDTQLGLPEVDFGLMTDAGGLPALVELAGPSRAKYLVMTGSRIDSTEAHMWGIVDRVVSLDELMSATEDLARALAKKPSAVVGLAKRAADAVHATGRSVGADLETIAQLALFAERKGKPSRGD